MASGVIAMSKAHGTSCGSDSQEYIVGARPWYMTRKGRKEMQNALWTATFFFLQKIRWPVPPRSSPNA
eukprot:scaffold79218_cov15-Tisochrysis_lutea.AAC.2